MDFKPNLDVLAERRRHAAQTKNMQRQHHHARSNESIIRRVWRQWTKRRKIAKRDAKLAARKAAHEHRMQNDPTYRARMDKRVRDYIRCRLHSCHNVDHTVYDMAEARGIPQDKYEWVYIGRALRRAKVVQ